MVEPTAGQPDVAGDRLWVSRRLPVLQDDALLIDSADAGRLQETFMPEENCRIALSMQRSIVPRRCFREKSICS